MMPDMHSRVFPIFLVVVLACLSVSLIGCGNTTSTTTTTNTTTTTSTTTTTPSAPKKPCLCLFDVDRTLTGKQDQAGSKCPQNEVQNGVHDTAYGVGSLTLSEFALAVSKSECAACYLGTITAGEASGPNSEERKVLHSHLAVMLGMLPSTEWSRWPSVTAPLVVACPDRIKQNAVPGILAWYGKQNILVNDEDVHFFDDRDDNIEAFRNTSYNARQISCGSRDRGMGGVIGFCGAALHEVVLTKGVSKCDSSLVV
mmetsp:Transcript_9370/g.17927  ORF Transcript_9370/g.17927 Transcript_9370/m.17927 type:complete len:256 (+) Transcript_9370:52-819(+)